MYLISKGQSNNYLLNKFCIVDENKLQEFIDKTIGKNLEVINYDNFIKSIKDWDRGPIDDAINKDTKHVFNYDLNDTGYHCIGNNGNDFYYIEIISKFEDM